MKSARAHYATVGEYFSTFSGKTRYLLDELRETIREAAPEAKEVISYNMPAFKQKGVLVYFAAYEHHIGFYPTSSPIRVFKKDLTKFKTSKGAIQFPIEGKIPKGLVKKIVKYRVIEDLKKRG